MGAMMVCFIIEQRWVTEDGRLRGEVVEISDDGISEVDPIGWTGIGVT
jgi:hypothetical protein